MDYVIFMLAFTLWYALSLIISIRIGKNRDIGEEWSFFICMMFTPIIGYLVSVLYKKKTV